MERHEGTGNFGEEGKWPNYKQVRLNRAGTQADEVTLAPGEPRHPANRLIPGKKVGGPIARAARLAHAPIELR